MAKPTTKKGRMDLAYAALLSEDELQVRTALDRIEQEADASAIKPLLLGLGRATDAAIQQRITSLLFQVKAKNAVPELVAALDDPTLLDVRVTVLASFWNAGLDVRDHLTKFIDIAIDGDAEECFECLTVVENQEIWPEVDARKAMARVKKAAPLEADAYKGSMLNDLVSALEFRLGIEE